MPRKTLRTLGEFGLIERIRRRATRPAGDVILGIGDDAAVLRARPGLDLVATTDMLTQGVHFDLRWTTFYDLGVKAVAANISDLAAMGAMPSALLVALSLPPSLSAASVDLFYRGVRDAGRPFGAGVAGGDTIASPEGQGVTVCVTALGWVLRDRALRRSGAKPGDLVFVTGSLGDSAVGLELLSRGIRARLDRYRAHPATETGSRGLIRRHLHPVPRVEIGRELAERRLATAAIDVSDGLLADLAHIARESRVRAVVELDRLPLSPALRKAGNLPHPAGIVAATGGEDYEILFTARPEKAAEVERVARLCPDRIGITRIGQILRRSPRAAEVRLVDSRGRSVKIPAGGYEHFRSQPARKRG